MASFRHDRGLGEFHCQCVRGWVITSYKLCRTEFGSDMNLKIATEI
jgi:hypothetical protein